MKLKDFVVYFMNNRYYSIGSELLIIWSIRGEWIKSLILNNGFGI